MESTKRVEYSIELSSGKATLSMLEGHVLTQDEADKLYEIVVSRIVKKDAGTENF
jgi:hypothetical protein